MVKFKHLLPALAVGLAGVASGQAQSLGLNFAATDPDAGTSSLGAADVAGVVPHSNWNNLDGNNGTDVSGLSLSTGASSTAVVSWTSPNTWRSGGNNGFADGPDKVLTSGYLDTGDTAAGGISITVSSLDPALTSMSYDVYVYFVSDSGADRGGGYTLDDGNVPLLQYGSTLANPTGHVLDPGDDNDNTSDGTYLRFSGLTGSSFTLTSNTELTTPNGFRAPINGIQIVGVPEPGTIALSILGGVGLLAMARRRRNS